MKLKTIYHILLFFWLSGIFFISLFPNPSKVIPFYNSAGENALHFIAFFVLFFLIYFSIRSDNRGFASRIVLSASFTILLSIVKEIGQFYIPVRTLSSSDFFVDCAGAGLCALILAGINLMTKTDHS